MVSELVAAFDDANIVADYRLLAIVLLNLTDDADINIFFHGLLAHFGKTGAVIVHPLLDFDEASAVLDLVRGGRTGLIKAPHCTNQLDLVEYESKEQLRERLQLAIKEGLGFGFV